MTVFWRAVNKVIKDSDIVLEVLDARMIDETRNKEIEDKIKKEGKQIIYVINKCDLISQAHAEMKKKELFPCVFISSKERLGTKMLREKILRYANKEQVKVGVVGYPNVGKSSIINVLKGVGSAKTSPESGYTKGIQHVRMSNRILLIDTPGVIPYKEKDESKLGKIAAKNFDVIKDPEGVAIQVIEENPDFIRKTYGIKYDSDAEKTLEDIALKFNKLIKGGMPDTIQAAKIVLKDWQRGR